MKRERDQFIKDNLNLVHSCCHRFKNKGIEYDDLFSVGCIGLIQAYDRFDSSLGYAFSTYAVPVILGEIRRLFREDGTVKIGRRMKETCRNISKARQELQNELSREPTVSEIANRLGISTEQVADAFCASQPVLSLDYEDDEGKSIKNIPSTDVNEQTVGSIALEQTLNSLPEIDRELIILRYYKNNTQTVTAEKLGMTQVQVSRREKKILTQIREKMLN